MNKNWEIKVFGEVCEIIGGSQPPKTTFIHEPKEGYIRLIQVRDFKTDKFITYIPIDKAKKLCAKTDIMIGRYGPPIFGIFRGLEGAYNVALMKAVPDEDQLDKEFFYWFLKTDKLVRFVEKSSKRAAGQDGVRKDLLYKYPIPVPPLEQQKQIVEILDKTFEAIEKAKINIEKNIQNTKELFDSRLNEIFSQKGDGWEEKKLNQISINLDNKRIPITKNKRIEGEIPYYGASGIVDYVEGYIFDEDLLLVSEDGANLLARTYPISFGVSGKCWVNNHAHILKFENIINQKFVEYYLNSIKLDDYISGMAQPKLNQTKLNLIPIPYPNIEIQTVLIENIDKLSEQTKELERHYQQKLDNLEELKKSILEKAFSGELLK